MLKGYRWQAVSTVSAVLGLSLLLYPTAASWVSQYRQSQITESLIEAAEHAEPAAPEQLDAARRYNEALDSDAVLGANERLAQGVGQVRGDVAPYERQLAPDSRGVMARLRIPSISVDLPVYHGTSEDTLLKGAGHLRGTSLPVGGPGTRTVITAHRGLAGAEMFTHLDKVAPGDQFTFEVMGEALVYQVIDVRVIDPSETESLLPTPGRDLATLVTCTPLGINTHRILVTGERVDPTPLAAAAEVGKSSGLPGFPWWLLLWISALGIACAYLIYLVFKSRTSGTSNRKEPTW